MSESDRTNLPSPTNEVPCTHQSVTLHHGNGEESAADYYTCDACGEEMSPELLAEVRDLEAKQFEPESLLNPVDGTPID